MKSTMESLIVGSLLHDIGKVIYRSRSEIKQNHSILGQNFISSKLNLNDIISDCAGCHHYKETSKLPTSNHIAYIVYQADNISSAMDRKENDYNEGGFNTYDGLSNIFMYKNNDYKMPIVKLSKDNIQIPSNDCIINSSTYLELLKGKGSMSGLEEELINTFIGYEQVKASGVQLGNALLSVLEKYLSSVPSTTENDKLKDISLYDHSKTTAAIASCLYCYFEERGISDYRKVCFNKPNQDEPMFLLVSGDMSGIQNFIYNVESAGALQSLRGRSFYLEIFMEHIIDEILDALQLSNGNKLFCGGGHFTLLLPNTEKAMSVLELAKINVNKWLLKQYGIDLYVAIEYTSCSSKELKFSYQEVYSRVSSQLTHQKIHRYQFLTIPEQESLFAGELFGNSDSSRECSVCKTSTKSQKLKERYWHTHEICENCHNMHEIGKSIIDKQEEDIFISFNYKDGFLLPSIIDGSDIHFKFISANDLDTNTNKKIYSVNAIGKPNLLAKKNIHIGNYNFGKDMEELALCSQGVKRLGILRADVDNLGNLFSKHFVLDEKTSHQSISRYSVLSSQLSIFFLHNVNQIAQGKIRLNNSLYENSYLLNNSFSERGRAVNIIYSGGDDLFIIGAWNQVLEFALDLNKVYKKFTLGVSSLSAGFSFYKHNYPIYLMARETELLESLAKSNKNKDSICLFNDQHVYEWEEFEEKVLGKLKFLLDHFYFDEQKPERNKIYLSTSYIYKLNALLNEKDDGMPFARFLYMLGRLKYEEENKETYFIVRDTLYQWFNNKEEKNSFSTCLLILVYLCREVGEF